MLRRDECVACGHVASLHRRGMVAPFLAARIWNRPAFDADLMRCSSCGMMFFNPRLDPDEEQALYRDYRSPEYQRARQAVEPWYTRSFNANLTNADFMASRRRRLAEEISRHIGRHTIRRVLDFGGDTGGLVNGLVPSAAAYVYDISAVHPEAGVTAIRTLDECRAMEFDLIVNSNVLEHVGDPLNVLNQIRSIAGRHTLVFLEVPFESPTGLRVRIRRFAQLMLTATLRPKVAVRLAGPRGFYLMHEHVNYFSSASLEALVKTAGYRSIAADDYAWQGPAGAGRMGWCLAATS